MHFHLRRSRLAAYWLTGVHALAIVAIIVCQFPPAVLVVSLSAIVFSLWQSLRLLAGGGRPSTVLALSWPEGGDIELEQVDGRRMLAHIEPSSAVLHWMMVLRLRAAQRRLTLVLLPDMLDKDTWRRLTVRLRALGRAG